MCFYTKMRKGGSDSNRMPDETIYKYNIIHVKTCELFSK